MDIISRYRNAFSSLVNLSNELERTYGRFLPGSPTYIDILKDMQHRGINDERIAPTITTYNNVMTELSMNPDVLAQLR